MSEPRPGVFERWFSRALLVLLAALVAWLWLANPGPRPLDVVPPG